MEGKTGILERSYQDTFQEMEKSNLSFLTTQNENVSLKTRLYELELKYEKAEDQHKKELDHAKYLHQIEKANLEKRLSGLSFHFYFYLYWTFYWIINTPKMSEVSTRQSWIFRKLTILIYNNQLNE